MVQKQETNENIKETHEQKTATKVNAIPTETLRRKKTFEHNLT